MNKFLSLPGSQRRDLFASIADKAGLPAPTIEKDFWVTAILQIVFDLPIADKLVFKGGTSLSKVWGLIKRFSEDIDLALEPSLFSDLPETPTKKQIKRLRKSSSLYVKDEMAPLLRDKIKELGLEDMLAVEPEPNGKGDNTYPEPRQIYIHYKSVFTTKALYLRPDVVLEVSSRSLLEPIETRKIKSIIGENIPITPLCDSAIHTAIPEKRFWKRSFCFTSYSPYRVEAPMQIGKADTCMICT